MTVVTRFAPSPTGYLHIGGARTALFNWLFARHHKGTYLLRIEDTDRARSTDDAIKAIFDGLTWLGLDWDGDVYYQFSRAARHADVVQMLLDRGHAYRCYATPEELETMRAEAKATGRPWRYDGRWRDRPESDAPKDVKPVIRFKAPREGATTIPDQVQGTVTVANEQLDDLILLRADGTPTYNLSVVVDDFDMGVTHVIRGDDHLTNAFRQAQLYNAMGWRLPAFAHIPLIHGPDGAKLSKRHGALGVDAYRDMGFLPEAMRNYLVRLGWSHGNEEIISTEQAIAWFDLEHVGRSPARLDLSKLNHLNGIYLRHANDDRLADMVAPHLQKKIGMAPDADGMRVLAAAMPGLKERAKNLVELAESATYLFVSRPITLDPAARKTLDDDARSLLILMSDALSKLPDWSTTALEACIREIGTTRDIKLGKLAAPLRAALTGGTSSPPIFDVLFSLGREESLGRIQDACQAPPRGALEKTG